MTTLESANWIDMLPEPTRQALLARMVKRTFADGEYLAHYDEPGTAQFQIISGKVRVRVIAENGKEITYVIYGPGDCIGYVSAIDHGPRTQDAIAIGTVEVNCLRLSDFEDLREKHPSINQALCLHFARRVRELYKVYEIGNFFKLAQQLAHQILFLIEFSGETSASDGYAELELTQETLASSVCATRQAVSKLLKEWADAGIVDYRYGRIRITDPQRLQHIAESPEP